MIPINRRLLKVSEYIKGKKLADIGSDHAYLPIYALQNGLIQSAIAGEVIKGPFTAAKKSVAVNGLTSKIDVRLGDGLTILEEADCVDTVTICGMGGPLITRILENGLHHIPNFPRLVLQSNIQSEPIRRFLQQNGYKIIAETLIKERAHIYEIIVAERGEMHLSALDFKFGPFLQPDHGDLFKEKWQRELDALSDIKKQLNPDKHAERYEDIIHQETVIKEVLNNEN
ncbi:tRNA (adenine(22)-N(1))-methyltransferase TrmK [Staphylococcus hyicus]|uniref:tRNA (Adenine(22)-N(1))-methyltransferase n=1 Tax=Staphylococcus hyicus TaxID=1284 RepID=A0ACD5FMH0_STAHY|nr:tRNA (adenine(22)-N(1))-methyltransferase TrmK [Staphylococcus hyicus]MDP4448022.1 tRNA (adenine(22)-N(1))-methyltransferase TrmK [Staphylococcus hyicus]MDP4462307.1 tRNA (adenine(22)-N(1))-methyltransferase TrmK [Staphylococcus hyicus]MDY3697496.1 tRNA (adenine(22)-N(1))-methyltransferase TrmK [Staphylococcus hyicus]PTJ72320.1 tRNA methyltransferase [Staphylococcus hyicus]PTJ86541.1 tRNA methyltransferase [Staphylococcus hyicus]